MLMSDQAQDYDENCLTFKLRQELRLRKEKDILKSFPSRAFQEIQPSCTLFR